MRLVPGDTSEANEYLWPIASLSWWRGEKSYSYSDNPYRDNSLFPDATVQYLQKNHGKQIKSFVVDTMHGECYKLSLEEAKRTFRKFAEFGKHTLDNEQEEGMKKLICFMNTYGVPCDGEGDVNNPHYYGSLHEMFFNARSAAICGKLLDYAQKRKAASIKELAVIDETKDGTSIMFGWNETSTAVLDPIVVKKIPSEIRTREWIDLAFEALQQTTAKHAASLRVIGEKTQYGTQLVLASPGLKTTMWLSFRLILNDAMELPEGTKECLSNGRFHGCGRKFVPSNPRQKLCPDCRVKSKTEAQARWRANRHNTPAD